MYIQYQYHHHHQRDLDVSPLYHHTTNIGPNDDEREPV